MIYYTDVKKMISDYIEQEGGLLGAKWVALSLSTALMEEEERRKEVIQDVPKEAGIIEGSIKDVGGGKETD